MAAVVLCITFAAWIALLALRDETVASCNQYLSQVSSGNTEYYDLPGSGPLGTDRGDCDASVRNLTIFGAFVVFVGNALQVRVKILISPWAMHQHAILGLGLFCSNYHSQRIRANNRTHPASTYSTAKRLHTVPAVPPTRLLLSAATHLSAPTAPLSFRL